MAISEYQLRVLNRTVELIPKTPTFLKNTFFGASSLSDKKEIDIDKVIEARRTAVYVTRDQQAKTVDKEGYSTSTYVPPVIKLKTPINLSDLQDRLPGEILYSTQSVSSRRDQLETKILGNLSRMIDRSEELQCSQAIFSGTVTVTNGETVSFGRTAANNTGTLTAARRWDQTTAKPLQDFDNWKKIMLQNGKCAPTDIIMDSDTFSLLANNEQVLKLLDNRSTDFAQLGYRDIDSMQAVAWRGYLNGFGNIWTYDNTYLVSATETPFVPVKTVAMISRNQLNAVRHYGVLDCVVNDTNGKRYSLAVTERLYDKVYLDDPAVEFIRVQSAPLMATHNPDAVVTAQVIA